MKIDRLAKVIFMAVALSSCATGSTVHQTYANPVSISFEYTHWYSGEKPYAMQRAEEHCNRYGKHAQLASESTESLDRSSLSFNCVKP